MNFEFIDVINKNWFYSVIILPIIIGFFKSTISTYIEDRKIYKTRKYDDDKNPKTGEYCLLQSGATGNWNKILIKEYKFGILPTSRKVITIQESQYGKTLVAYSYDQWKNLVTGTLPNND